MLAKWRLMFFYFLSIVGILLYLKGFFPIKISREGSSSMNDVPPVPSESDILTQLSSEGFDGGTYEEKETFLGKGQSSLHEPVFTKLVLIVVNALREDFLFGSQHHSDTPFLQKALSKRDGIGFISRAQAPAVTLPRIKSLMTGSVPSYTDVILSLDQPKELKDDNFVNSAFGNTKSIVFYGDEDWMRMFPGRFKRQQAVSSVFIRDFKDVDEIVMANVHNELAHPDHFDVMIVDILGLGHIGHVLGSKSPLISEKLTEIDSNIETIYEKLRDFDLSKGSRSLIVVTGDHGMTDKGSHGGTTQHERDVPLIFLSPGIGGNITSGGMRKEVQQTDLAATLSILLGVPIPRNSMGQLIGPLLQKMNPANQLHSLEYNCHHLLSLAGHTGLLARNMYDLVDPVQLYREALLSHATWVKHPTSANKFTESKELYSTCQRAVSDQLKYHVAAYNHISMAFGMLVTWVGYLAVMVTWGQAVLVKRSTSAEDSHNPNSPITWGVLVTAGTVVHGLSLLSSSFLEEEHQTWYYMTSTFLAVLFMNVINEMIGIKLGMAESIQRGIFSKRSKSEDFSAQYRPEQTELLHRAKSNDSVDSTWDFVELETSDDENTFDRTIKSNSKYRLPDNDVVTLIVLVGALLAHRFLRAWNSTGIQSVDTEDIGDWLNDPDNYTYLSWSYCVGLFCIAVMLEALTNGKDVWRMGLVWFGLLMVYICRLDIPQDMTVHSYEEILPVLTYLAIAGVIFRGLFLLFRKTNGSTAENIMDYIISSVILLSALLLRPHNIWPLVFNLFLYWSIFRRLWPIVGEESNSNMQIGKIVLRTTLCYWFGQMSYFSLGNSNSLATIDVSSGYIGLSTHYSTLEDTLVRLLIAFATYSGPILWTMLCLVDTVKSSSKDFPTVKQSSHTGLLVVFSTISFLRLTPMTFYLILATAMRYHQFVWSVFAPKLLYETASTVIYGTMLLSASFAAKWIK